MDRATAMRLKTAIILVGAFGLLSLFALGDQGNLAPRAHADHVDCDEGFTGFDCDIPIDPIPPGPIVGATATFVKDGEEITVDVTEFREGEFVIQGLAKLLIGDNADDRIDVLRAVIWKPRSATVTKAQGDFHDIDDNRSIIYALKVDFPQGSKVGSVS